MGPAGTWHYYAHLDDHKRGLRSATMSKRRPDPAMSAIQAMRHTAHICIMDFIYRVKAVVQ